MGQPFTTHGRSFVLSARRVYLERVEFASGWPVSPSSQSVAQRPSGLRAARGAPRDNRPGLGLCLLEAEKKADPGDDVRYAEVLALIKGVKTSMGLSGVKTREP